MGAAKLARGHLVRLDPYKPPENTVPEKKWLTMRITIAV